MPRLSGIRTPRYVTGQAAYGHHAVTGQVAYGHTTLCHRPGGIRTHHAMSPARWHTDTPRYVTGQVAYGHATLCHRPGGIRTHHAMSPARWHTDTPRYVTGQVAYGHTTLCHRPGGVFYEVQITCCCVLRLYIRLWSIAHVS